MDQERRRYEIRLQEDGSIKKVKADNVVLAPAEFQPDNVGDTEGMVNFGWDDAEDDDDGTGTNNSEAKERRKKPAGECKRLKIVFKLFFFFFFSRAPPKNGSAPQSQFKRAQRSHQRGKIHHMRSGLDLAFEIRATKRHPE